MNRKDYEASRTKSGAYPKSKTLEYWLSLKANQDPLRAMVPIPNGSKGSSYGACGVRIDGTPEFIDAVLSCLKSLIDGEGDDTRLELARSTVQAVQIKGDVKTFDKAPLRAEVCYIRLHERGEDAKHVNRFLSAFATKEDKGQ